MKSFTKYTALFLLCAGLLFTPTLYADTSLSDALKELETYTFGDTRLSQTVILAALRDAHGDEKAAAELAAQLSEVLQATDSVDAKRYICRMLGELGHAGGVDALALHLSNEDMYDLAAWALRQIQDESATVALLSAVDRLHGRQKLEVIQALGYKNTPEVIQKLGNLAVKAPTDEEAAAAFDAIARIPSLDAASVLIIMHGRIPAVRNEMLLSAKVESAQLLDSLGEINAAKRMYQEVYQDATAPTATRASALYGLVRTDPANSTALLLEVIQGEDAELSRTAAKCVRMLVDADTLATFSGVIDSLKPDPKRQLLQALTDRGEKVGEIALRIAKSTDDPELKLVAAAALGKAGTAEALDYLLTLTEQEGNNDLGRAARTSLASLPADVDAIILAQVQGADAKRAELLLRTLEERRAEGIAPQLLEMVMAKDQPLRKEILKALEALAVPEQFDAILALLADIDSDSRRGVEKVLIALGQKLEAASEKLLTSLDAASQEALYISAAKIIAGIGQMNADEAYRTPLEKELSSENEEVRSTAIRALGEWPNRKPLDAVLAAAESAITGAVKDALYDSILSLVSKSQVLVAPPEGSNYELTHLDHVVDGAVPMGPHQAMGILDMVLKNTVNDGLRKKALSALGKVTLPEALQLAESYAKRPELRLEAHNSMLGIAKYLLGADREAASNALQDIVNTSENELHKNQAQALLNQLPALGDYIMAWRVSGPYAVGDDREKVHFQDIMPTTLPDAQPFVMDFLDTLGGFVRRVYLVTTVQADTAMDAVLELGSDDGITVWLNGKQVHDFPEGRELIPGDDKIPVSLKQGDNLLKIVVHQKASYWHMCARLADADGKALKGVKVSLPEVGSY